MNPEILMLCGTAATLAFVHTLLGPDHYLPFVSMAKSQNWSFADTVKKTLVCGVGHIAGSVLLGCVGILMSIQLHSLTLLQGIRGDLAGWALLGFGMVYMIWGIRRAYKNRAHAHWHSHPGVYHFHIHNHHRDHAHLHDLSARQANGKALAPWAIFIIFVLGPCETLIPLLMYPAAKQSFFGVFLVTSVFAVVTVMTMLMAVIISLWGLQFVKLPGWERFSHAISGCTILMCGFSILILGL